MTRPKPITPKDEGVYYPAPMCTQPIEYGDLGLVDEFNFVAKYTRDPDNVKVTVKRGQV